jgi:hypothetical protein
MKTKFLFHSLKIGLILAIGLFPIFGIAQNTVWVTPPYYMSFQSGSPVVSNLPIPTGVPTNLRYNGQGAEFAANGMHDAAGNLLLFVVDDKVYNGQGHLIGGLIAPFTIAPVHGLAEIAIVPVPGDCCKFYVISFGENWQGQNSVFYQTIDICIDNPNFPDPDDGITGAFLEYDSNYEEYWPVDVYSFPGLYNDNRNKTNSIAVSKENNNERIAFVYNNIYLSRLKITSTGITFDNYEEFFTENDPLSYELELFEDANGMKIALATEVYQNADPSIIVKEYNSSGIPTGIQNNFVFYPTINSPNTCNVTGIEFSPSGDYLYFNINNTTVNSNYFYYLDLAAGTLNLLSTVASNTYRDGFLETGKDGKLYYINANGMGTLDNPNFPSTSTFVQNAVGFPSSLTLSDNDGTLLSHERYFSLPDQIDGEDLTPFVDPSQNTQCCADLSVYEEWIYSASSSSLTTWDYGVGNNPWNVTSGDILIEKELIIPSGRTLTIKNMTFRFAPDAKVTVEKNARLTMNNATFTSVQCPVLWKGVEVWGTPSVAHALATNVNYGYINVINNSEISNALNGITSCQRDNNNNYILTQSGGYVLATNSDFINNIVDVDLTPHVTGFFPSQSNKSTFRGCRFTTNGLLNDLSYPDAHVRMVQVSGVKFFNNDFRNLTPLSYIPNIRRGTGIYSVDSKYMVTYGCSSFQLPNNPCPEQNRIGNTFSHLYYGINASSGNPLRNFVCEYSEFNEVQRGIRMVGMLLCKIDKNNFYIGDIATSPLSQSYGIHQTNCSGYFLQNNHFEDANNANYGVITVNSGAFNNLIRNNTFEDLEYGATAIKQNYGFDINQQPNYIGLQYLCNDFTGSSQVDVQVPSGGIREKQGKCPSNLPPFDPQLNESPANNTFSTVTPPLLHFTLDQVNVVQNTTYIYPGSNFTSFIVDPANVTAGPYSESSCTPAAYTSKTDVCQENTYSMVSNGQLLSQINLSKSEIASLLELIDGGNTQNLLNAIASQSSGQVKNTLMAASPYLSDEVLLAYLATNPPAGHIQQIILANSPVSQEVLDYLNGMNLPNGIRNQINAGQIGESGMDVLKDDVSAAIWEKDMATDELLRRYLNDTLVDQLDSMDIVLKQNETLESDAIRVAVKVYQGKYTEAATLISEIRLITNQYNDYLKLMESLIIIYQCQDKAYRLNWDTPLKQDVETIANAGTEKIECKNAGSILELLKIFSQPEVFENVNPANARSVFDEELPSENEQYFTLYPNPTNNYLNIKLPVTFESFTVEVYDMTGKLVYTQQVPESDYALVNTTNFNSGIYSVRIITSENSYTSLFVKE